VRFEDPLPATHVVPSVFLPSTCCGPALARAATAGARDRVPFLRRLQHAFPGGVRDLLQHPRFQEEMGAALEDEPQRRWAMAATAAEAARWPLPAVGVCMQAGRQAGTGRDWRGQHEAVDGWGQRRLQAEWPFAPACTLSTFCASRFLRCQMMKPFYFRRSGVCTSATLPSASSTAVAGTDVGAGGGGAAAGVDAGAEFPFSFLPPPRRYPFEFVLWQGSKKGRDAKQYFLQVGARSASTAVCCSVLLAVQLGSCVLLRDVVWWCQD